MLHEPLDSKRNEIRLVTILPGVWVDDIKCTLSHISLLDPPIYTALSYCWGDAKDTEDIYLNNQVFSATTNLKAALLQLRKLEYTTLWIDAICIDQANIEEKSQQLPLIGSIYRNATTTIAWLGEESRNSHLAFALIEKLWQEERQPSVIGRKQPAKEANKNIVKSLNPPLVPVEERNSIAALLGLLRRPYWKRVWIIQELAFSQKIKIFCGGDGADWSALKVALQKVKLSYSTRVTPHVAFSHVLNIQKFRRDTTNNKPLHFLDAIGRSQASLASHTHDKLFALVNLCYNGSEFIPIPDYTQEIEMLCCDITMAAITSSKSLDVIVFLGNSKDGHRGPTWQPHWLAITPRWASLPDKRRLDYLLGKIKLWDLPPVGSLPSSYSVPKRWNASKNSQFSLELDGSVLRVKGFIIGSLSHSTSSFDGRPGNHSTAASSDKSTLGQAKSPSHLRNREIFDHIFKLFFEIGASTRYTKETEEKTFKAFYSWFPKRAELLQETYPRLVSWFIENSEFQIYGKTLAHWMKGPSTSILPKNFDPRPSCFGTADVVPREYTMNIIQRSLEWNMRLMVTDNGRLGWANSKAGVGDRIAILLGCSVPVLLRERNGGGWLVVGDCVVNGLMNGEGLEGCNQEKMGWIDLY